MRKIQIIIIIMFFKYAHAWLAWKQVILRWQKYSVDGKEAEQPGWRQ